jgi:hypothetical protein
MALFGLPVLVPRFPSGKGTGTLGGWLPEKQVVYADVLIKVRPMDAMSLPNELPDHPVFRSGMGKTRIPRQRDCHATSV